MTKPEDRERENFLSRWSSRKRASRTPSVPQDAEQAPRDPSSTIEDGAIDKTVRNRHSMPHSYRPSIRSAPKPISPAFSAKRFRRSLLVRHFDALGPPIPRSRISSAWWRTDGTLTTRPRWLALARLAPKKSPALPAKSLRPCPSLRPSPRTEPKTCRRTKENLSARALTHYPRDSLGMGRKPLNLSAAPAMTQRSKVREATKAEPEKRIGAPSSLPIYSVPRAMPQITFW